MERTSAEAQPEDGAGGAVRKALLRSGAIIAIAVGAANVLNAAFQFALARILEPADYALLAALFAIVLVAAIPPLAFQATAAREVSARLTAGDPRGARNVLRGMAHAVARWVVALLALGAIAVPVAAVAGADDPLAFGGTAATVAVALAIPVVWGGLQGAGRFPALAGAHVCFAGTRLAAGVAIGLAGGGVGAIMLGLAGATALTVVVTALPIRSLLEGTRRARREPLATRSNAWSAVGLTALWALIYGDLLVARLAFGGVEAGAYAAASVGARVILLFPIAATTVLYPRVAALEDRRREARYLVAGLLAVGAASAVAILVGWLLDESLVEIAFGDEYAAGAEWLGPLCLAMALYGLAMVYLYHFLALGRPAFATWLAALFAVQLLAYGIFHGAPEDLIIVQLCFGSATLVAADLWYRLHVRRAIST
jgi:O-antigen/teichoic acid export membrane protein